MSFAALTWLIHAMPRGLLRRVSRIAGGAHWALAAGKRRNRSRNLARVGAAHTLARPWEAFQNHMLNVLELLETRYQTTEAVVRGVRLCGQGVIDETRTNGRGVILATIHTGNWERAGLALASSGYPLTTVAGLQLRDRWSEDVKAIKRRFGIDTVSHRDVRQLYRDLVANRVVVLHIDGNVFTGGLEVTFLGKSIRVPRGPARLSRMAGTPVAFAYCLRAVDGGLDVFIEPAISPPTDDAGERALTERLVARAEAVIAGAPNQWCIFREM